MFSLVLLMACNSIVGFTEFEKQKAPTTKPDSGSDDDTDDDDFVEPPREAGADTMPFGPRCTPGKPFGTPVAIDLDTQTETKSAIMTRDELEIFYIRGTSAPFDLRHSIRESRTAKWPEPTTEALNPSATQLGGIVLGGKKLHYWSVVQEGASLVSSPTFATRPKTLAGGFSTGTKLGGTDRAVFVSETDDIAYYAQSAVIDAAGEKLIHRGNLQGSLIISDQIVPNIHANPSLDSNPVINSSELIIYFDSTRKAAGTQGASDIWRAERTARTENFGTPVVVPEVSSSTIDEPSWLSEDDCILLMTRSRHILMATRPL